CVCFAGLACSFFLTADTDANYRSIGRDANRRLSGHRHSFFRRLRRCEHEHTTDQSKQKSRQGHHFTGTNTLTTSLSGADFTGSVAYSSMNRSWASSCLSSRKLVIASYVESIASYEPRWTNLSALPEGVGPTAMSPFGGSFGACTIGKPAWYENPVSSVWV